MAISCKTSYASSFELHHVQALQVELQAEGFYSSLASVATYIGENRMCQGNLAV